MTNTPEIMSGTSLDIAADKRTRLKELFPTVFTETVNDKGELTESVDFERLKAELGTFTDLFENRRERYGMDWPGKKEALKLIQTVSHATLKPCREESVNFDTTGNLFIEGDNLEVLKLLQKSYYGKVKMITIDPPYNTGKEFIYPDNFSETLETYLEYAGLIDGQGKRFSTNTANEGRFHTKWLNMMYPRLYLARNLLRDDGVIFISIDDNEVNNLRKLCDEIFGEDNFESSIIVQSNKRGQTYKDIAKTHEYMLVYTKTSDAEIGEIEKTGDALPFEDSIGKYDLWELRNRNPKFGKHNRPNLYFPIYVSPVELDESGYCKVSLTRHGTFTVEALPKNSEGEDSCWRWGKDKLQAEDISSKTAVVVAKQKRDGEWNIYQKSRKNSTKAKSIWDDTGFISEQGTIQLGELELSAFFDHPKPVELIKKSVQIGTKDKDSDIILDFFGGSATTAHAILALNKDGGNRKFILVQLPEPCPEESEAFKAGYKTIADIGKERIRRVINKMEAEENGKLPMGGSPQDRGFKVLKLDKSNFKQWQALPPDTPPEKVVEQLKLFVNHIEPKAGPEDLLYEILIKAGFPPSEPIASQTLAGKTVYAVSDGGLLLCLEETVTPELINAVVEAQPQQFICLDAAFGGNDQLKANAVQTFAAHNLGKEKYNQIVFRTV